MIKSTVVTPWKEISWGYDQQYICHQGLWSTKHLSPHGVMNNSTLRFIIEFPVNKNKFLLLKIISWKPHLKDYKIGREHFN